MRAQRKQKSVTGGPAANFGRRQKTSGRNGGPAQKGATPTQSVERYLALAREAEAAGDIVQSQYFYQHAEHYVRKENARAGGTATPD